MPGVNGGRRRREAARARSRSLLAGSFAVGLVAAGTVFGAGTASAETALIFGGARGPGIPWDQITNKVGRGYYPNANRRIVEYPAGMVYGRLPDKLWPGNDISTDSVGDSVDIGARNLKTALQNSPGQTVVVGNSEGALVLSEALARLSQDPGARAAEGVSFTLFGPPQSVTPFSHSVLSSLTPGTYVPLIDYTVRGPVESQYDTTLVVGEYDFIADFPDRPDNFLALANSLVALEYLHTETSYSSRDEIPPQNVFVTVNSRGATQTMLFLPTRLLPLTRPLRDLGVPNELVDQLDGVVRPMVDAGYSRNDYPGAPATGLDPVARANVEDWLRQAGTGLSELPAQQAPASQPTIKLSRTDQENVDKAVQGIKLSPTDQANMDNAAQQVKNLFPGIG
ncbi:PE-PPE domain-containing protein [Mycobacterium sp. NPDC050441]|uniref:PE-PPE domain-containing protein n=1 Tax=Mycobacterium sp. NPDC050441 TaxID=3155403 RepID=UPI003409846D